MQASKSMEQFPSGPWSGFYAYSNGTADPMDLCLEFCDGHVHGNAADRVGPSSIVGNYDSGRVRWTKRYATHSVHYQGHGDGNGFISGFWEIDSRCRGTFRIWPGAAAASVREQAEAEETQEARVPVGAGLRRSRGISHPTHNLGDFRNCDCPCLRLPNPVARAAPEAGGGCNESGRRVDYRPFCSFEQLSPLRTGVPTCGSTTKPVCLVPVVSE
jgi:hypothetical protein